MADLGMCISCTRDTGVRWVYSSGRRALAEAVFRRFITPRGVLIGDPNYGTDVTQWLNAEITAALCKQIQSELRAEAEKDPRVESAEVTVSYSAQARSMTIAVTLEDADGPFEFVVAVSSVSAELLQVEGA